MSETEKKIIEAAIRVFVRYGARKTTMADIASEADVSRQTLYASFGGKDDLIVASIRYITGRNLERVRSLLPECSSLGEQLEVYFAETVVKSFELLQSSSDAADLVAGHNEAGRDAILQSHQLHKELIGSLLVPYTRQIGATGQSPADMARFIVAVVMGFKTEAKTRDELDQLLKSLKIVVLLAAEGAQPVT
ncbi:TetR/AcrR family transcriptional regulator [Roseibium sp.]|uniref:TetR/AcrR family transcriptional regulator n=1 Tax=Roseibium sp. TaxID=1936156 RepID=UPI003BAEACFE